MVITIQAYQAQLLIEVKDDGTIAGQINFIWEYGLLQALLLSNAPTYLPLLQYNYCLVKACDTLLGTIRDSVDFKERDRHQTLDQLTKHLEGKRADALLMIEAMRKQIEAGRRAPKTSVITTTAPIQGKPGYYDPNSDWYRGNPGTYVPPLVQSPPTKPLIP